MVLCQLCCCANIVYAIFPFVFTPDWRDVVLADITPSLAFFGLRNTAWAGHIVLKNAAGEWRLVVSSWGRIRLCERNEAATCQ
ncbi:prepilin peptidase dependent protein A [Salmonella enterica]|nr:prepilin peptidase dependent protein A [Salmonella enterica]